jgi:hypothetical protein
MKAIQCPNCCKEYDMYKLEDMKDGEQIYVICECGTEYVIEATVSYFIASSTCQEK